MLESMLGDRDVGTPAAACHAVSDGQGSIDAGNAESIESLLARLLDDHGAQEGDHANAGLHRGDPVVVDPEGEAVKAAHDAFYAAFNARDGLAMADAWLSGSAAASCTHPLLSAKDDTLAVDLLVGMARESAACGDGSDVGSVVVRGSDEVVRAWVDIFSRCDQGHAIKGRGSRGDPSRFDHNDPVESVAKLVPLSRQVTFLSNDTALVISMDKVLRPVAELVDEQLEHRTLGEPEGAVGHVVGQRHHRHQARLVSTSTTILRKDPRLSEGPAWRVEHHHASQLVADGTASSVHAHRRAATDVAASSGSGAALRVSGNEGSGTGARGGGKREETMHFIILGPSGGGDGVPPEALEEIIHEQLQARGVHLPSGLLRRLSDGFKRLRSAPSSRTAGSGPRRETSAQPLTSRPETAVGNLESTNSQRSSSSSSRSSTSSSSSSSSSHMAQLVELGVERKRALATRAAGMGSISGDKSNGSVNSRASSTDTSGGGQSGGDNISPAVVLSEADTEAVVAAADAAAEAAAAAARRARAVGAVRHAEALGLLTGNVRAVLLSDIVRRAHAASSAAACAAASGVLSAAVSVVPGAAGSMLASSAARSEAGDAATAPTAAATGAAEHDHFFGPSLVEVACELLLNGVHVPTSARTPLPALLATGAAAPAGKGSEGPEGARKDDAAAWAEFADQCAAIAEEILAKQLAVHN